MTKNSKSKNLESAQSKHKKNAPCKSKAHKIFGLLAMVKRSASQLLKSFLIFFVKLYQVTLRQFLGGHCKFNPTCSEYFIKAVKKHGPIKGSFLGIWRILRCNPFSKGGIDEVP